MFWKLKKWLEYNHILIYLNSKNMLIPKKIILALVASTVFSYAWAFAWWIDHFEVKFDPEQVKVNESLDLTIEAVDKNNETVLDYKWTILIFSESDSEAELPSELDDNTYTFKAEDQWKIKFENSVKFKSAWLQDIHIYDMNDDTVLWIAEATVTASDSSTSMDIEIASPQDWLTIWKDTISVSWLTQKNHQVKIIVNSKDEYSTTSNDEWIFEKEITGLTDWDTKIKAQILDADWKVIWESDNVLIKIQLNNLSIKSATIRPEKADPEDKVVIKVISNAGLTKVTAVINDVINELKETSDWTYTWIITAPKEPWVYRVDVTVQDDLWHSKTELWVASMEVNEVEMLAADEETASWEVLLNSAEEKKDLKITWLKLVELKTKSILTWDKLEDAESYNVYKKIEDGWLELIDNVKEPRFEIEITWDEITYDYFAVKAVAKTASWETYEWELSDATKIQTWPEVIILLILSMLIWWFVYMRKSKNA